ncbi:MAG: penicillin-binding protein 2 [Ruminococcus sp.]|nr:penicillin-binding protein 2 [Ruminococcus sp.]
MAMKRKKRNRFEFLSKKFPKRMQKKLVLLFMVIILAFIVLIARITYINASKGNKYTKIVLDQQEYSSTTIPYKRGDIVDRNGTKLATSERVYNVILDVYVMLDDEENIEPTIDVLKECFDIAESDVREAISKRPESRYEILATDVSYEKAQAFNEIDEDDENYPNIAGVWLEEDYLRSYPYDSLASDVVGFTVGGNVGALGIESAYNDVLNGTDGREYGYFSDESTVEQTVKAAQNGNTVVSTIDVTLQSIVEQCILEFNEAHYGETREDEPGSKNTAVMIMDPNTGEILAMASYPNFDLNNPRDMSAVYTEENWDKMTEEEQLEAMNSIWRNFCVSDAYEPGSTMKPFTVAAGLETGRMTGNETYTCGGYLHVGDWDIKCHNVYGCGYQTVADSVANSCNVALMTMASSIGVENFCRYQHIFGFGEYTGIDLPGEAYTEGLLYTAETMTETDLATNSFGQNFNVTMTQMAAGFASLINGGYYYEPHVVKQIQDENGRVIETRDPVLLRKTVSEETSQMVKTYLKAVVDYGTGQSANVEGYDIGAKTGTAEKLPRNNGNHLLSYIGYAPQENPEVLVYVVIDEPNVPDQSTSRYVLELAQKIMSQAFPYLNISTIDGYVPSTQMMTTVEEELQEEAVVEEYAGYSENFTETYDNYDGAYVDESYTPDYTDWAGSEAEGAY